MVNRMAPPSPAAAMNDIGGAIVRRPFTLADGYVKAGHVFNEEEVRSWAPGNRRALVSGGFVQIYPKLGGPVLSAAATSGALPALERHAVHRGMGKYDVIEGFVVATSVSKDAADALIEEKSPKAS